MNLLAMLAVLLRASLVSRSALVAENLALRQQLAIYQRRVRRPGLRSVDRLFWVCLARLWTNWWSVLVIVRPETAVRWHRQGFRLYWRWKSRGTQVGRPKVQREIRDLIRRISRENATWGAPRIQAELRLLGHDMAEATVAKYMVRGRKPSFADVADISEKSPE